MMVTQPELINQPAAPYNDDFAGSCSIPHDTASSSSSLPDLIPVIGDDDLPDLAQARPPSLLQSDNGG